MDSSKETKEETRKDEEEKNGVSPVEEETSPEGSKKEDTKPEGQAMEESNDTNAPVADATETSKCEPKVEDHGEGSSENEPKDNGVTPMDEDVVPEQSSKGENAPGSPKQEESMDRVTSAIDSEESGKCECKVEGDANEEIQSEAAKLPLQKVDEKVEPKSQDTTMLEGQETSQKGDDVVNAEGKQEEEPQQPQDPNVGSVVERTKIMPNGLVYPLQGTVVEYREQTGRIPPRWSVHWPTAENVTQEEEWIDTDLRSTAQESNVDSIRKAVLDTIQERYQENLERELESSTLLSTMLLYAAIEEALQTSLHQKQHDDSAASNAATAASSSSSKSKQAHPPLYYTTPPNIYLQAPTATDTSPSLPNNQVQMTPADLGKRVRSGCSWALSYLESKQPPRLTAPLKPGARRSSRQPKTPTRPTVPEPVPVKHGGRVAMYWLEMLQPKEDDDDEQEEEENGEDEKEQVEKDGKEADKLDTETNIVIAAGAQQEQEEREEKDAAENEKSLAADARLAEKLQNEEYVNGVDGGEINGGSSPGATNSQVSGKEPESPEGDDAIMEEEESEASVEQKNDDEDFKEEDAADDDEEELENVQKEPEGTLYSAPEPTTSDVEEHEEEDEDDEEAIFHENPYLKPSLPSFLDHFAKPKTITGQDIQEALCETILRIQHNKRSAALGLPISSLIAVDRVVLDQETPNYPPGKLVLNCASKENYSFRDLRSMDVNVFSRCKFSLDVIGEQEKSQQLQRHQELQKQEAEFKERKAWDKWRHRGIHDGCAAWPSWQEAIAEWVRGNITSKTDGSSSAVEGGGEAATANVEGGTVDGGNDDEALARSLEEDEPSGGRGRRRNTRRAATGGSGGVFYGTQSQLTQKQLGDALVKLVRENGYQTMAGLQNLVFDDAADQMRKSRVSIGRLVWKRNQLARKSVTAGLSDDALAQHLSTKPLLIYQKEDKVDESQTGENEKKEAPKEVQHLIDYVKCLHATELQLRKLVMKNLAEIPIPIVATAADERAGSTETLDAVDFEEDPDSVEWLTSGHDLLDALIYRPAQIAGSVTDMTSCYWYQIQDYSKPVASEGEDSTEDDPLYERRSRFRAAPCAAPGESEYEEGETISLTEAQVHAGMKAADLEHVQENAASSGGNPFATGAGDKVSLIPVDMEDEGTEDDAAEEIQGYIVAHDNLVDEDEDEGVEYRILFLPESSKSKPNPKAFWATLDVRADDSSYMCQPVGESTTWYTIEHFDYHQTSEAYQECENILNWLKRQSAASPFLEPVDPVALRIPAYFNIVKHPMDISTMEEKLENGHYSSIAPDQSSGRSPVSRMLNGPFIKDMKLMFDNAMLFNPPDDWIYKAAAELKKKCSRKIADTSKVADQKLSVRSSGRRRQKRSIYMDEDSDADMYEYESDQDDDYETGRRKRKRASRGGGNKDEFSSRAIEHPLRLQAILRDELRGAFANLPINSDASSFTLPCDVWNCRKAGEIPSSEDGESPENSEARKRAREMEELLSLQRAAEAEEASHLRRSTRAHEGDGSGGDAKSQKSDIEFFTTTDGDDVSPNEGFPGNRLEVEIRNEQRHEELYAKLYQQYSNRLVPADGDSSFGIYSKDSFPPYLGRIVPVAGSCEISWEIRSAFIIPALRWVLRGLIQSGHLTAMEPMTSSDFTSGIILTNDAYYYDANMKPFEVLDMKELLRRKRANKSDDDEESEEDIELSEYEKLRAARVARNQERLQALGLA